MSHLITKVYLMKKVLLILISVLSLYASDIDISQSKGTEQEVIASLSPSKAQVDVWNNAKIEIGFDAPLDTTSIQKHNVKLVHLTSKTNEHISGELVYNPADDQVVFTPASTLKEGVYEVEIKSLKTVKEAGTHIDAIKYRFYVPEVVNGYQLPSEPDEKLNNSTLLGIDFNNNGVRDDVERKIIVKYIKSIEIELMLSYAKAHQLMLNDPIGSAPQSQADMQRVLNCKMYLKRQNLQVENITKYTEDITYNTKERVKAYLDFNQALSGGVYGSGPADWTADACDFNIEQMLEDRQ